MTGRILDSGWAQAAQSLASFLLCPFLEWWDVQICFLRDGGKAGLCSGICGKCFPASHCLNNVDVKAWCSDIAVESPTDKGAYSCQHAFESAPSSEGQWEESLLHQLAFVHILSWSQLPSGLIHHLVVLETPKRERKRKKSSRFLCLKWWDPCVLCVKRGAIALLQFCFCVLLLIITRKEDSLSLRWYYVFAIGSCFLLCSFTSYFSHLFPYMLEVGNKLIWGFLLLMLLLLF